MRRFLVARCALHSAIFLTHDRRLRHAWFLSSQTPQQRARPTGTPLFNLLPGAAVLGAGPQNLWLTASSLSPRQPMRNSCDGGPDLKTCNVTTRSGALLICGVNYENLLMTRAEARPYENKLSTPRLWGRASKKPLDVVCFDQHRCHGARPPGHSTGLNMCPDSGILY